MDNDTLMIIVVVVLAMMLMKGNMLSNLFGCRENFGACEETNNGKNMPRTTQTDDCKGCLQSSCALGAAIGNRRCEVTNCKKVNGNWVDAAGTR